MKIAVCGVAGCGKTTLTQDLANDLKNMGYLVETPREFARDFIAKYGTPKNAQTQNLIFQKQLEREEVLNKFDILVSDSPVFLSITYALEIGDLNDKQDCFAYEELFASLLNLKIKARYDKILYIPPEFALENDTIRYQTDESFYRLDKRIRGLLDFLALPYNIISNKAPTGELLRLDTPEKLFQARRWRVLQSLYKLGMLPQDDFNRRATELFKEVSFDVKQFTIPQQNRLLNTVEEFPKENKEISLKEIMLDNKEEKNISSKTSLKEMLLSGKFEGLQNFHQKQYVIKDPSRPDRPQSRHLYQDCAALTRWKQELLEIDEEAFDKYSLCPFCKQRLESLTKEED